MPRVLHLWTFFNLLLCTTSKGGYEYIYCDPDVTNSIQSTTCYLNPYCPDKYVYVHTVVSDEKHERCDEPYHHLQVSPISGDFWQVYWSDPEGDVDLIVQVVVDVNNNDPISFMTNFSCSDGHYWTQDIEIKIQKIEVHIQVKWLQHDVYITCETNLRGVDTYNLITPHSTKSIRCVDDACGIKINHPDSGDYQCEVKLDGYSITSLKQTILDFSDSPPTQWMITARAPTINITAIGVGAAGVLLVIILTTVFSITIGILCYKVRQNGYQPLPNHDPDMGDVPQGEDGDADADGAGGAGGADGGAAN